MSNKDAFLALVRAGLWEKEVRLLPYKEIDFSEVLRLAEEQSVVGFVAAGLEHVVDIKVPKDVLLTFVGRALQLEQQNVAMNHFVAELFAKLQAKNINALLVKGQGIAQCYERPLWRVCGDVDLLLDSENYSKAKDYLSRVATSIEEEDIIRRHLAMTIGQWTVELHGTLHSRLAKRIDNEIDAIQRNVFEKKQYRIWHNEGKYIFLPIPNDDVIFVFTHILQHFFRGGIGLRQICDWCRLLWTNMDKIDRDLLEKRLLKMGLMSEWKLFASLAVRTLGMHADEMLFYDSRFNVKCSRLIFRVLKSGNFGHNKSVNYKTKHSDVIRKTIILCNQAMDNIYLFPIFPLDTCKFFLNYVINQLKKIR